MVTAPSVSMKVAVASVPHIWFGASLTIVPSWELLRWLAAAAARATEVGALAASGEPGPSMSERPCAAAEPKSCDTLAREHRFGKELANLGYQFLIAEYLRTTLLWHTRLL